MDTYRLNTGTQLIYRT